MARDTYRGPILLDSSHRSRRHAARPRPRLARCFSLWQMPGSCRTIAPAVRVQPRRNTQYKNRPREAGFCIGAPQRAIPRTWDKIIDTLARLNGRGLLPDLSSLSSFHHRNNETDPVKDGRDDSMSLTG